MLINDVLFDMKVRGDGKGKYRYYIFSYPSVQDDFFVLVLVSQFFLYTRVVLEVNFKNFSLEYDCIKILMSLSRIRITNFFAKILLTRVYHTGESNILFIKSFLILRYIVRVKFSCTQYHRSMVKFIDMNFSCFLVFSLRLFFSFYIFTSMQEGLCCCTRRKRMIFFI